MQNYKSLLPSVCITSVLLGASLQIQAQETEAKENKSEERGLEVIMVTAQKRSESLQNVPVAVSAFSGESLERMGVKDFSDLTKASPSLTIAETGGNKNENPVNLRGIGTYAFSVGIESSVALIVDDVPVARSGAFFNALNDVASIEILRGPQSTLFGKNSSAGLISVRTNDPSDDFEGNVEAIITSDGERVVKGMFTGPLSDQLGFRITAYDNKVDGWIKNLTTGTDFGENKSQGARAKLVWDPTDNLSMTIIAETNESEDICCQSVFIELDEGYTSFGATADLIGQGMTINTDNRSVRSTVDPVSSSEDTALSLKVEYELGEYTLTSVTAKRDWDYNYTANLSPHDQFTLVQGGPYTSEQFTQELRLTSPSSDDFEYIVGAYYTDIQSDRSFERGPIAFSKWDARTFSKSTALFGQIEKSLNEQLSMIIGLRYNHEEFGVEFDKFHTVPIENYAGDTSDDTVFGRAVLNYNYSDDMMIYGSYSQGYKAGGYDITSSFNQNTVENPVDAETVDSYEIGTKQTFLGGSLQVNTSLFYSKFEDFQAQASVILPNNTVEFILNNVGSLETSGIDVDIRALLGDNWSLNGGFSYTNAVIDSFVGADCYGGQTEAQGCLDGKQDLSGEELSNSPDFKASFALEYVHLIEGLDAEVFGSLAYQWQSSTHFDLLNNPATQIGAYGVANLNIGVRDYDDLYRVTFFINNITDQYYPSGISDLTNFIASGGGNAITHFIPRGADRYYGVRLRYNF
jgi:iron complex outermembrane receptor protein